MNFLKYNKQMQLIFNRKMLGLRWSAVLLLRHPCCLSLGKRGAPCPINVRPGRRFALGNETRVKMIYVYFGAEALSQHTVS